MHTIYYMYYHTAQFVNTTVKARIHNSQSLKKLTKYGLPVVNYSAHTVYSDMNTQCRRLL